MSYLPTIWFKLDQNKINSIGDKIFLIVENPNNAENQFNLTKSNDSIKMEETSLRDTAVTDGDILTSGTDYFMADLTNLLLNRIERDIVNSIIKI